MIEYYLYIYLIFIFILGLCVGSFLNVVIHRIPIILRAQWDHGMYQLNNLEERIKNLNVRKYNLFIPRSSCPYCDSIIPIIYNIPVLGWLFLKGRSQCCNNRISLRYPMIEILTAIITVSIIAFYDARWLQLAILILVWSLIVLTFIDLDEKILQDCITLPLLWCGLLININNTFNFLNSAVIGAASGYMFFWLIYWLLKILTGREGMGYGDFKLMAALGAWFGWEAIPFLTLVSSSLGIVGYILIKLINKSNEESIAFGPYLTISGVIYLFSKGEINYFTLTKYFLL